jgi:hypothetical protein
MNKCHRYTIERLYADLDRYKIQTLYVGGHLGQIGVPLALVGTFLSFGPLIRDGFKGYPEPSWTSPWILKPLGNRAALLGPNPKRKGKRDRNGLMGAVRMRSSLGRSTFPGEVKGSSRARNHYRDWQPPSDAPLIERILKSRRLAMKAAKQ